MSVGTTCNVGEGAWGVSVGPREGGYYWQAWRFGKGSRYGWASSEAEAWDCANAWLDGLL